MFVSHRQMTHVSGVNEDHLYGVPLAALATLPGTSSRGDTEAKSSSRLIGTTQGAPMSELAQPSRSLKSRAAATARSMRTRPPYRCFTTRVLGISDRRACELFVEHLDPDDLRMRFGSLYFPIPHLLPELNGASKTATLGAFAMRGGIVGIVNVVCLTPISAELGIIVRSDRKRRGIGRALLMHAIQWAGGHGLLHVSGQVLVENQPMRALARAMGFQSVGRDGFLIELSRPTDPIPV